MTGRRLFLLGLASSALSWPPSQALSKPAARVVSLGGAVTEIAFALGQGDRLVGRDTTSSFPAEAQTLPDVGYVRRLSPEGVLSVAPDLILAEDGAGPPGTVALLKSASVPMVVVPSGHDGAAVPRKIAVVAEALGVPVAGAALSARVTQELAAAQATAAHPARRVLFVLSTQGGRILAAGRDTSAEGIITLAGGVNATRGFTGYKPLSDEAIAAAAPDVILMMQNAGPQTPPEEVMALPALRLTPAGRNGALVRMDGLKLLGFGPRVGAAVAELSTALARAGT